VSVAYQANEDETPSELPLHTRIQETDISWADLTLAFLWWPNSRVVGDDTVRGRECLVLDIPAPERAPTSVDEINSMPYTSVRLWVDREMLMLLQAEGRDSEGDPMRKLWVKSLKKIDGQWMIKDMEIQSFPPIHRTRLRIREVSVAATS
jgi:hypothetical protein